jgi:hypothetical protein
MGWGEKSTAEAVVAALIDDHSLDGLRRSQQETFARDSLLDVPLGSFPGELHCAARSLLRSHPLTSRLHVIRLELTTRLSKLRDCSTQLAALTKTSSTAYAACAGDFVRAARIARSVRRDLEVASRRIA